MTDLRAQRGLAAGSVVLLVALAGLSFAPWFRRDIEGSPSDIHESVNLWQGSTLWEWSFVATAVAVTTAVVGTRVARRSRPVAYAASALGSGAAVAGMLLWLRQWWLITHPVDASGGVHYYIAVVSDPDAVDDGYAIGKDTLPSLTGLDYNHASQTWCAYLGVALMFGIGLAVLGLAVRWINSHHST